MNRLDSIKLQFPDTCVDSLHVGSFKHVQTTDTQGNTSQVHRLDQFVPYGLKECRLSEGVCTLELSAKVLQGQYFEGISRDTALSAIAACSNHGISFDPEKVLDSAILFKADTTLNVALPGAGMKPTLIALQTLRPKAYIPERYKGESVVFRPLHKTSNKYYRQTFYDKQAELNKHKADMALLPVHDFLDTIRYEVNLKTFAQLRVAAGTGDRIGPVHLHELLYSDTCMNLIAFQQLLHDKDAQPYLFTEFSDDADMKDIVHMIGIRGICIECNLDPDLIDCLLRKHTDSRRTYTRWKTEVFAVLRDLQAQVTLSTSDDLLAELHENMIQAGAA